MDEWTVVGGGRGKKGNTTTTSGGRVNGAGVSVRRRRSAATEPDDDDARSWSPADEVRQRAAVDAACAAVAASDFHRVAVSSVPPLQSLVGLGIGRFTASPSALLQLAFLSCLRAVEGSTVAAASPVTVVFDPLFSPLERRLCEQLGLTVSAENRRGMHRVAGGTTTLFFMPHCPYRLYVNLLWENWECLEHVVILGNSFQSYGLRRSLTPRPSSSTAATSAAAAPPPSSSSSAEERSDCLHLLRDLVTEVPLWEQYREAHHKKGRPKGTTVGLDFAQVEAAFCDTSLHYFTREALQSEAGRRVLAARPSRADIEEAARGDVELFYDDDDDDNDDKDGNGERGGCGASSGVGEASSADGGGASDAVPCTTAGATVLEEEVVLVCDGAAPLFATNVLPHGLLTLPNGRKIVCQTRAAKQYNDLLFVDDIWPGARALVDYLTSRPDTYRGKCVLELGAGAALPGLAVAADGAAFVLITDYPAPDVVENIQRLIAANDVPNAQAMGHVGGEDFAPVGDAAAAAAHAGDPLSGRRVYDVVLMAELLWKDTYPRHRALLTSIVAALAPGGTAYASFAHRPTEPTTDHADAGAAAAAAAPPPPSVLSAADIPSPSLPPRACHTAAHDLEFFALAQTDFGLDCRVVHTCDRYTDVGGGADTVTITEMTHRTK